METKSKKKETRRKSGLKKNNSSNKFPIIDRTPFFGTIKFQEDPLITQRKMRDDS